MKFCNFLSLFLLTISCNAQQTNDIKITSCRVVAQSKIDSLNALYGFAATKRYYEFSINNKSKDSIFIHVRKNAFLVSNKEVYKEHDGEELIAIIDNFDAPPCLPIPPGSVLNLYTDFLSNPKLKSVNLYLRYYHEPCKETSNYETISYEMDF